MKRTTLKLPEQLDARLRHEAARRQITVSQLTREAIEAHLGAAGSGRRQFMSAATGRSGYYDISERIEELLHQEMTP